jgi:hypothetical protein
VCYVILDTIDFGWKTMRFIRWAGGILCTLGIVIIGTYTIIALAVAFFIVSGRLTPGNAMWIDSSTPTLTQTLLFASMSGAVTAGLAFVRNKLFPNEARSKASRAPIQ